MLVYFPDKRPKVIRYYKRGDSLNEKLISYYPNGKKEYIKYWLSDLGWKYKEYDWYESGAKKSISIRKFKDTVRTYNPADSCYRVKGLVKETYTSWYENGVVHQLQYPKDGKFYEYSYNDKGELVYPYIKTIRPDGYDSVETHWYVQAHKK